MWNRNRTPSEGGAAALLVALCLTMTAAVAEAQVTLYDDFTSPRIDENKWVGRQFVTREGGTGDLLEIQREISAAQMLVLQTRVVGGRADMFGTVTVENALAFRHAQTFDGIVFDVAVRKLDVTGCVGTAATEIEARAVFALFDDGFGDVVADVGVMRSSDSAAPAGELEVTASLVHRSDAGNTLLDRVSLGSAVLGQQMKLRLRWDAARSRVRVQRDADAAVSIGYVNAVLGEPARPHKYLAARAKVGDCATAPGRGAIVAVFDDVRVDP